MAECNVRSESRSIDFSDDNGDGGALAGETEVAVEPVYEDRFCLVSPRLRGEYRRAIAALLNVNVGLRPTDLQHAIVDALATRSLKAEELQVYVSEYQGLGTEVALVGAEGILLKTTLGHAHCTASQHVQVDATDMTSSLPVLPAVTAGQAESRSKSGDHADSSTIAALSTELSACRLALACAKVELDQISEERGRCRSELETKIDELQVANSRIEQLERQQYDMRSAIAERDDRINRLETRQSQLWAESVRQQEIADRCQLALEEEVTQLRSKENRGQRSRPVQSGHVPVITGHVQLSSYDMSVRDGRFRPTVAPASLPAGLHYSSSDFRSRAPEEVQLASLRKAASRVNVGREEVVVREERHRLTSLRDPRRRT